jgi:hypothetical protein
MERRFKCQAHVLGNAVGLVAQLETRMYLEAMAVGVTGASESTQWSASDDLGAREAAPIEDGSVFGDAEFTSTCTVEQQL